MNCEMKATIGIITLGLLLLFSASYCHAEGDDGVIINARPKVGLVLGGGGAKGAAHIGVLKYLEEIGIPIDYVAGTSMGSIIGGLYALGYSADELDKLISELDWSVYMSNTIERDKMSSADKYRRSTYLLTIPFNTSMILSKKAEKEPVALPLPGMPRKPSFMSSLPSSVIRGSNLINLFNNLCVGYQDSISFYDLPIPFACVATDITDGKELVMHSGKFPTAIRASMAIPGVFAPVRMDGHVLMDGGMVNNYPADVCYEMGANIIIGVDVSDELTDNDENLQSLPQLFNQLMSIAVMGKKKENRALCDVHIHPDISGYNTLSFDTESIDTLIQRGYREAKLHHDELMQIKERLSQWGSPTTTLQAPKAHNISYDTIVLRTITLNNTTQSEAKWLLRKGRLKVGKKILGADIEHAVGIYNGTGSYANITYNLHQVADTLYQNKENRYDLTIDFDPSAPHSFGAGFRFDSEENAAVLLNAGYNQQRLAGWRFLLSTRLSTNPWVNLTLTWAGRSLANFNLAFDFHRSHFKLIDKTGLYANISNSYSSRTKFYISEFHLRRFSTEVGFEVEKLYFHQLESNSSPIVGFNENYSSITNTFGPYAKLTFDDMDDAYFAKSGVKTNISLHWRIDDDWSKLSSPDANFFDLGFHLQSYLTPLGGRLTFIPEVHSRFLIGKNYAFNYKNLIGGPVSGRYYDYQLPFIGLNSPKIVDDLCAIMRFDIRYNFYGRHYLHAMLNYLHAADNLANFMSVDLSTDFLGVGLKYSIGSPIGPVDFEVHWSEAIRSFGTYIGLGYVF